MRKISPDKSTYISLALYLGFTVILVFMGVRITQAQTGSLPYAPSVPSFNTTTVRPGPVAAPSGGGNSSTAGAPKSVSASSSSDTTTTIRFSQPCPDPNSDQCLKDTHDQMDGGYKFRGITFKEMGNGVLLFGYTIIVVIATIKIVFGGIMYATAAGNPQRITEAKSHIYYALIGIALIVGMNVLLVLIGAQSYF